MFDSGEPSRRRFHPQGCNQGINGDGKKGMSNISRQDLKTILLCAVHLAKVDNEFHMMERKILRRISEAIGLKFDEREDLVVQSWEKERRFREGWTAFGRFFAIIQTGALGTVGCMAQRKS